MRPNQLIIYYAIVVHFVWGGGLLTAASPVRTSTLNDLYAIVPNHHLVGLLLILIAGLATTGLFLKTKPVLFGILLLIPQQFVISLSALTAIAAIADGRFADGVVRPQLFIFLDQLPAIVIAVMYTIAIFEPIWRKRG